MLAVEQLEECIFNLKRAKRIATREINQTINPYIKEVLQDVVDGCDKKLTEVENKITKIIQNIVNENEKELIEFNDKLTKIIHADGI